MNYECYFDNIKNNYDNKLKLLFIDTNSLMIEIKTEDVYENFNIDKEILHFTNYSKIEIAQNTMIIQTNY